jgi:hypothetical protein
MASPWSRPPSSSLSRTTAAAVSLAFASLLPSAAESGGVAFFENHIRPVLSAQCFACHSAGSERLRGGLRLDTREDLLKGGIDGPVIIPGNPDASLLIQAIRHEHPQIQMPPVKSGNPKLPDEAIRDFTEWVRMGAPYPPGTGRAEPSDKLPWSLSPITDPSPPVVRHSPWIQQPLDAFVLARMEASGATPAPAADKYTLIRRAAFDLTGLPPEPDEVAAFLSDTSAGAFAAMVDRFLASPRYGEHWGRHWLDVARYADTAGDTADYPLPEAWRYRNYVIASFNADKPYDEFIREQIAGDIMARDAPHEPPERYAERVTATGFLALSRRFGFDSENYHHLTLQDTIDTLGQSVMGLTLGCARCHDHKFDPVTTRDYYGLYGIFASTRYAFPGSEQKNRYRALTPLVPPAESDTRLAAMQDSFAAEGLTPEGVLRSLDDHDGDFEMQKPAAGGSYGVLVPPWLSAGKVSATAGAQSPFRNVYPFGIVGAHLSSDSPVPCSVRQTMHTASRNGLLHVSLDFRTSAAAGADGHYRFSAGPQTGDPAISVLIARDAITISPEHAPLVVPLAAPGEWHSLQLQLDLSHRCVTGHLGRPGAVTAIALRPLQPAWQGVVNSVALSASGKAPDLDIDNLGYQTRPMAGISTSPAATPSPDSALHAMQEELTALMGYDGDLEGQRNGESPAHPWHPGPGSTVKIAAASQSPFRHLYPAGQLGINLPQGDGYNGLGLNLPVEWSAGKAPLLHLAFDFRCSAGPAGNEGTWRFHLGHGPGSAALELGFHAHAFFCRSGDARNEVARLQPGAWHQVRLTLDLMARRYTGSVGTGTAPTTFSGTFATGWDGRINYAFIDSGGHIGGIKPVLDADNFSLGTAPLPPLDAPEVRSTENGGANRRLRIAQLEKEIEAHTAALRQRQDVLRASFNQGPVPMAYAVSDGTPQDARIQLRGEPDRPGEPVPRSLPAVLGGGPLPPETTGSGRRELAAWITRRDHPLTARVMVNRIWQQHFGRPLVRTPNDFGKRSEPPANPELLDHLASVFVQSGWSLKTMHRIILRSATWQQSTATGPYALRHAELHAGFSRRRLSAEEIRDAILSASGQLDPAPGEAHPFPPPASWSFSQHVPFAAVYDHRKRSVYLMVQRLKRHPYLALFDGADPNASTGERRTTTVPTQALYFLNDPFVHDTSMAGAAALGSAAATEDAQISLAIARALGRPPRSGEVDEAMAFLADYRAAAAAAGRPDPPREALAAFLRTLFGSNEFLHCE